MRVPPNRNQAGSAQPAWYCRYPTIEDGALAVTGENSKNLAGTEERRAASTEFPRWKRILDISCILLTLPCWSTLMICATLWIKAVSPGPIFYRQERVGYRAKRFRMSKFRTMKVNVETVSHERHLERLMQANCPMTKLDAFGDGRIIRGGRILRATGLDELPQLFDVLRGEMSLVGPRPCTPQEFQLYEGWQRERLNAPPGLTGYWQVSGKNKTTFTEMVNMDIFYARNMSVWLDLAIILKTLPAVVLQLLEARIGTRAETGADKPVVGHF
jgi:exopolysaccharide production protein ExoY